MIKTAVFEKNGRWWFKWWDILGDKPLAQDWDGPFKTKHEAEVVRQGFVKARQQKYPHESFESE